MAKIIANLTGDELELITSLDNVVMPRIYETIENGRSLDVTNYTPKYIKGGHLIIKKDGEANYAPMPVSEDGKGYASLPSGYSYAGFQIGTIPTDRPQGAIMIKGSYVTQAAPYPIDTLLSDVKTALPFIYFKTKED